MTIENISLLNEPVCRQKSSLGIFTIWDRVTFLDADTDIDYSMQVVVAVTWEYMADNGNYPHTEEEALKFYRDQKIQSDIKSRLADYDWSEIEEDERLLRVAYYNPTESNSVLEYIQQCQPN